MANQPLERFKFPGIPDTFIIPKSIISSEIEVTSDNYATIITNLDDQPVNTIYSYAENLQSKVTNLPSNKAMTIINFAQKYTGGLGQVMLAVERNGSDDYLYFRTIGGSPAVWSSWVKTANNSDVEAVREALDNLDIETDKSLSISGKPADAKAAGDEINNLKADLIRQSYANNITVSGRNDYAGEWNTKDITTGGGYIPNIPAVTFTHKGGEYGIDTPSGYSGYVPYMAFNNTDFIPLDTTKELIFDVTYAGSGAIFDLVYSLYDSSKTLIGSSAYINFSETSTKKITTTNTSVAYIKLGQLRYNSNYAIYPSSILINNFVSKDANYVSVADKLESIDDKLVSVDDEIDAKENKIKFTTPLFVQSRWKLPTEGSGVYLAPNVNAYKQWCRTAEIIHIVSGSIIVPTGYYGIVNTYPYNTEGVTASETSNYSAGSTITFTDGWYGFMFRHADYSPVTPQDIIDDITFNIVTADYNPNKVRAYFIGYKDTYMAPGDCTVFITPNGKTIMVDSLKPDCATELQKTLWTIGISNFDVVILSHYHIDHIGGVVAFLQSGAITFNNCTFYMANQTAADWATQNLASSFGTESIAKYESLKQELAKHSEITQVFPSVEWQTITVDDTNIIFYNTDHNQYAQTGVTSNYNDFSLCCYINYGMIRTCLSGDVGIGAMTKLSDKMYTADIYKSQHHGLDNFRYRYYASIIGYWLTLNPKIVISEDGTYHNNYIETDENYPLQHWLEENCIPNYRTNVNGTIYIEILKEQYEIITVAKRALRQSSMPSEDKEIIPE